MIDCNIHMENHIRKVNGKAMNGVTTEIVSKVDAQLKKKGKKNKLMKRHNW